MPNLLVKPKGGQGRVTHVTPESAGWTYVGFDLHRVKAGETISAPASDRESCLVWISGKSETSVDGQDFGVVGERMSPFEGAPHALYVAPGSAWQAKAVTDLELAVCSAPGGGDFKTKLIPPGTHPLLSSRQGIEHAPRHQHHAGRRQFRPFAAGGRGDHAERQHVLLSVAQTRPG